MEGEGFYDNDGNISFGIMVHGITYSDEAVRENEKAYDDPVMECIHEKTE